MRIAIDTGGTFTDCVWVRDGRLEIRKVFSTPRNPAEAVLRGVEEVLRVARPARPGRLDIHHGTTVGTNALLERKGGRVALITTAGFEDVIEIGRQARPQLYNLFVERPPNLVPARLRFGVRERVAADGRVLVRLTAAELGRVARSVARCGAESVAICLLFSFLHPTHEQRLATRLRKLAFNLPTRRQAGKASKLGLMVSASHEILPEFREYERTSTVVVNAYLLPRMGRYLTLLEEGLSLPKPACRTGRLRDARGRLPARIPSARVRVMQSSGGIISARVAAREPVRTILSGPAGGVVGGQYVAGCAGFDRIITFDMGGTSTDVSLVDGGIRTTHEGSIGDLPVAVPMVDVHSVGAGGGSLARFDAGGALRVGPQSAGADPGPICYGRGEEPTVTDAHLLLGRLDPEHFLGGEFHLDLARTRRVVSRWLESRSHRSLGLERFAQGVIAVANATMEKAIRVISIERGHDPRRFTLVAFGGAGGLHACELASSLRIPRVLVPKFPGGLSALGILRADIVKDFSRTVMLAPQVARPGQPLPQETAALFHPFQKRIASAFAALEAEALRAMRREGFLGRRQMRLERSLDLRYVGQAFELTVPARTDSGGARWRLADAVVAFHDLHERRYGYADPTRPVEVVNVRLRAIGFSEKFALPRGRTRREKPAAEGIVAVRPVIFSSGTEAHTPFYDRVRLRPGNFLSGPAIIVEYSATTVLPPGWRASVDAYENLLLSRARPERQP